MADFMLFAWPAIALVLFARLGRERGIIWSIVAGYLLLPEDRVHALPGLPDYDKVLAISIGAMLGVALFRNKVSWPLDGKARAATGIRPGRRGPGAAPLLVPAVVGSTRLLTLIFVLLGVMSIASVLTVLDNQYALIDGPRTRQGLGFRDVINMVSQTVITLVPLLLAALFLRTKQHFREVLVAIVICVAFYAFLAAVEVRLSPRMNVWVYGYFQHSWAQHLREGGFRPVVFLDHGLSLGFILLTAILCALALFRSSSGWQRTFYLGIALWVLGVLLISKNLGATMLAVVCISVFLFVPRLIQTKIIAVTAAVFLIYPLVRQAELLPLDGFLDFVGSISEDRRDSLAFRLDNETDMLLRAAEKPIFGWGGWGRWRVIDERGDDTTVSDGTWIIMLGEQGWVGYICFFGFLTLPLFFLSASAARREAGPEIMALGVVMTANLVYLVPNSTLTPVGWLITGTIVAFLRWDPKPAGDHDIEKELVDDADRRRLRYSRFSGPPTAGTTRG